METGEVKVIRGRNQQRIKFELPFDIGTNHHSLTFDTAPTAKELALTSSQVYLVEALIASAHVTWVAPFKDYILVTFKTPLSNDIMTDSVVSEVIDVLTTFCRNKGVAPSVCYSDPHDHNISPALRQCIDLLDGLTMKELSILKNEVYISQHRLY